MHNQTWNISDLLLRIKILKDKVNAFETGEKYIRMMDEFKKTLACEQRRNRELEKKLADSHAALTDVRNKYYIRFLTD